MDYAFKYFGKVLGRFKRAIAIIRIMQSSTISYVLLSAVHTTSALHHAHVNIWCTTHYTDSCQTVIHAFLWILWRKFCVVFYMPRDFEPVMVFSLQNPSSLCTWILNDSHFPSNRASAIRLHLTPPASIVSVLLLDEPLSHTHTHTHTHKQTLLVPT